MIFVEILTRHHDVSARHRVGGDQATIGRAYDNDVVVDDPHVAAHHARVFRDESGALRIQDLGSVNGLCDAAGRIVRELAADPERPLRLGRTLIRVHDERRAVPPERPLPQSLDGTRRSAAIAAALSVAMLATVLGEHWLQETGEPRGSAYVLAVLAVALAIGAWTAAWSILSRIFGGAARFGTHLSIALCGALALQLFEGATSLARDGLALRFAEDYAYVGTWLIVAALAWFHLRAIGAGRLKVKTIVVASLGVLAIGAQSLVQAEYRRIFGEQPAASASWPSFVRAREPRSPSEFFRGVDAMKPSLDQARTEEPGVEGMLPFPFDE